MPCRAFYIAFPFPYTTQQVHIQHTYLHIKYVKACQIHNNCTSQLLCTNHSQTQWLKMHLLFLKTYQQVRWDLVLAGLIQESAVGEAGGQLCWPRLGWLRYLGVGWL